MLETAEKDRSIWFLAAVLVVIFILLDIIALSVLLRSDDSGEDVETVLRIGLIDCVDSLNPFLGLTEASAMYSGFVYDCLQTYGEDMAVVPNLATDWHIVPDADPHGSVWEYDITPDARWHDGEPFTVRDVEWNINLNCLGGNYSDMGAYQPYAHFSKYAEVVDNDTVRVTYYDRDSGELMPCAYANMLGIRMVPRHLMADWSTSMIAFQWTGIFDPNGLHPVVGTGPFMPTQDIVSEFEDGDRITLVRNPNYHWEADKGMTTKIDKIIMYFFDDATAMSLALKNGMLDVARFPADAIVSLEKDIANRSLRNVKVFSYLSCNQRMTHLMFYLGPGGYEMQSDWKRDPAARRAIMQAVDKKNIVDEAFHGRALEGNGLISPLFAQMSWSPAKGEAISFDFESAADSLESAGYVYMDADSVRECSKDSLAVKMGWAEEGEDLSITITATKEHPHEKVIADYLAWDWRTIGINATVEVSSVDIWPIPVSYKPTCEIVSRTSNPDPAWKLFCQSNRSLNWWSDNLYDDPDYNDNFTKSVRELDQDTRAQHVRNCQAISYQDAAYSVLAYEYSNYAWRTDTFVGWGNWVDNPGRSLDASWGANPLLFELEPVSIMRYSSADVAAILLSVAAIIVVAVVIIMLWRRAH